MDVERVLSTVRKLIALSSSPQEHEATRAAVKACAMIREHEFHVTANVAPRRPEPKVYAHERPEYGDIPRQWAHAAYPWWHDGQSSPPSSPPKPKPPKQKEPWSPGGPGWIEVTYGFMPCAACGEEVRVGGWLFEKDFTAAEGWRRVCVRCYRRYREER